MGQYAKGTTVGPEKTRSEIEKVLQRYGCDAFAFAWEGQNAMIAFKANGRAVRFEVPIPDRNEFKTTPTGQYRYEAAIDKAWDQGIRQRWRALLLVIKAKLEAVDAGIVTFEEEFLAHFILPSGKTVAQELVPELDRALEQGMPSLLPPGS